MNILIALLIIGVLYWATGMTELRNPFMYQMPKRKAITLVGPVIPKPKEKSTKTPRTTKTTLPEHIEGEPYEFVLFVESTKGGFIGTTLTGKRFFIRSQDLKLIQEDGTPTT